MTNPQPELAVELERDSATLERELAEIEMLMQQAASEAERHETRRVQAEERLAALERDQSVDPSLTEAREQLLAQTRRQILMQSQLEILAGKQRALRRYHDRLQQIVPAISGRASTETDPPAALGASAPAHHAREDLTAQDEMRREIARQMHDGPAQSIANIALQAQVVQRLFARDPSEAAKELNGLVAMVQNALEQTKGFIFGVRPMVLDDLGLVPTLRRAATERSRRSGLPVTFESIGADSRLPKDVESGLFRFIDDAVQALVDAKPSDVNVRLDWIESAVSATMRGRARGAPVAQSDTVRRAVAAAHRDKQLPAALASMIHEQETSDSRGIPSETWAELSNRADQLGIDASLSEDGWQVDARVSFLR